MTKPGTNRPSLITNPKFHLGAASSSSKSTRKPFHPPLPLYSPSRLLQHGALRWSPSQVEDDDYMLQRNNTPHYTINKDQSQENLSQVPLVQDIYNDAGRHIPQKVQDSYIHVGHQHPQRVENCVYKQSTNEGDIQKNKKNLTWTSDMDAFLLDCLLGQMQKGQKIGGNFTKSANLAVAHLAHPSASIYRYKPVQHWEKMDSVYGQDRATGEYAIGPNERVRRWDNEENNVDDSSEQREVEENSVDIEPEPTSSTSRPKLQKDSDKKRKRVVDLLVEELRSFREGIDKVAEAINPRNYTEKELFEHIQRINGMSLKNKMKVYKALTKDVSLARAFLGCCEEMHKL